MSEMVFGVLVVFFFIVLLINASVRHIPKSNSKRQSKEVIPVPSEDEIVDVDSNITEHEFRKLYLKVIRDNPDKMDWWFRVNGKLIRIKELGYDRNRVDWSKYGINDSDDG